MKSKEVKRTQNKIKIRYLLHLCKVNIDKWLESEKKVIFHTTKRQIVVVVLFRQCVQQICFCAQGKKERNSHLN
jgi:hypothetical protein